MDGASSDTSYLNIGTDETSSHPEIKPEIEVVEATGDSNEVCGLERKECDEIMEHLKNNPGLVVKSLGSEGQIVLHVAVMIGEATKKPKPPTFECNDKGFSKAKDDSDWYGALGNCDCNALMSLLQTNPCLVAQTGPEGMTVLHAAALGGCLKLLHQVLDLFKTHGNDHESFVDEISKVKVDLLDLFRAKYGSSEMEFQNIAWFTLPRNSYTFAHPKWFQSHNGIPCDFKKGHALRLSLNHKLFEIIQRKTSKKAFEGLEERYQDYYSRRYTGLQSIEEMQFIFACINLDILEVENYLKTIICGFLELETSESAKVLTEVFQLHNEKGKTPFHATYELTKLMEIVPTDVAYKACVNVKDVRGWTILHCFVAAKKHSDLASGLKALLQDERIDVNARTSTTKCDLVDGWTRSPSLDRLKWHCEEEVGMTALHLALVEKGAINYWCL